MPPPPQFLLQAVPVDQLHGVKQMPILVADPQQADDVRMFELSEGLDFGLEPHPKIQFLGQAGGQQLDGGRFARLLMDPFIDRPHAAAAELPHNLIRADPFNFHGKEEVTGIEVS